MFAQENKTTDKSYGNGSKKATHKEHNPTTFEEFASQCKMKPYPEPKGSIADEVILGGSLPETQPTIQQKTEEEEPLQGKGNIQLAKGPEEEEEPLQGKGNIQLAKGPEEEELLQGKGNIQLASNKEIQTKSPSNNGTGMPNAIKGKMENAFNTDFSDVKIHTNSAQSEQLGALAYTQGRDVHFASNQYNPETQSGQELLGHELTHVVQQRQGRVKPTKQGKGMSINDSPMLENEADVMGKQAAQGKSVEVSGMGNGLQKADDPTKNDKKGDYVVDQNIIGQNEVITGMSLLGTIKTMHAYGRGGSGYSTINVVTTTDAVKWSQILNKGLRNQSDAIKGFLLVANDPAKYVGKKETAINGLKALIDVSRDITTDEKRAFMRALFHETENPNGKQEDLKPVDFTVMLGTYMEDGLLAKFINDNYGLAIEEFNKSHENPIEGAKRLVQETTTSENTTATLPSFDESGKPIKNPRNGSQAYHTEDVLPPVMQAIVSNAYVRALSFAKKFFFNSAVGIEGFSSFEEVERNAQMIKGAIAGHKAALDSINAQNDAIFDAIWSSIPFTGAIKNPLTKVVFDRALDVAKSSMKSAMQKNPLTEADPQKIYDRFDKVMYVGFYAFIKENPSANLNATVFGEILNTFLNFLK